MRVTFCCRIAGPCVALACYLLILLLQNSRTPLHYACYWGDMELVMPLLELEREVQSGLVNVRDRNGDTGLHIAARGGFKAVVKELLKVNANKDIKNMVRGRWKGSSS